MKKLTAYHFEFLATEIAPMIDPAYIENDSFARTIKSFANNPRFDIARFSQKIDKILRISELRAVQKCDNLVDLEIS